MMLGVRFLNLGLRKKDKLFNDVCDQFESMVFPKAMTDDCVKKHVEVLVNCFWYLDGNKDKFQVARSFEAGDAETVKVTPIPERYSFTVYTFKY